MQVRHDSAAGEEMAVRRGAAPTVDRIAFECEARIIARLASSSTRPRNDIRESRRRSPAARLATHGHFTNIMGASGGSAVARTEPETETEHGAMTMRNPRLYVDLPLSAETRVRLPEVASHHLTRVLRLGSGAAVTVFNGCGGEYDATVASVAGGAVQLEIGAHRAVDRESALVVELGQGICKGDRMDLVMQKATELGVSSIRPIVCRRTVVKLDAARAERRIAHWRAVAVHAAQQSGRTRVPDIGGVENLNSWLSRPATGPGIVLSPHAADSVVDVPRPGPGSTVRLLVGPEGGLEPREVERVRAAGFVGLRLGPRVLRTETAALVALGVLQSRWGDLQ